MLTRVMGSLTMRMRRPSCLCMVNWLESNVVVELDEGPIIKTIESSET
jgi:hypothetical protein